jgi:hypothetical protein
MLPSSNLDRMGETISCFVVPLTPRVHLMVSVVAFFSSHSMEKGLFGLESMVGWIGATHYNEKNHEHCNKVPIIKKSRDARIHKG